MKNLLGGNLADIPLSSAASSYERKPKRLLALSSCEDHIVPYTTSKNIPKLKQRKSVIGKMNKLGEGMDCLLQGIREHVSLSPNLTETVKGKLSLGAKILKVGGLEKIFKQKFSVKDDEKLLKVSQCYLSTTAGPIAGLLYISTDKIAFCSERSIKLLSPTGKLLRIRYKVSIPISKVMKAKESENMKNPSQKYIQLITEDDFEFWFMGFLNHQKTLRYLQHAISIVDEWVVVGYVRKLWWRNGDDCRTIVGHVDQPKLMAGVGIAAKDGPKDEPIVEVVGNSIVKGYLGSALSLKVRSRIAKGKSVIGKMNKLGERMDCLLQGIREHVSLSPNLTETVKGKLNLGAKLLNVGGLEKIFKQKFSVKDDEKLLKVSQCYLSTTAGPIAGLLYISSDKVSIPISKVMKAKESENMENPSQKYIQVIKSGKMAYRSAFKPQAELKKGKLSYHAEINNLVIAAL
ncbi:GEM-like protein 6 [Capsicum baccatum]|uniref:GEM-like protein 6 n=1 Tax=Capsicum baccatum TaxID=33114 RepID=A0A2G2X9J8_CAPBA|nr:GEM-like protein 6 [Capsicum baccatum]